MLPIQYPLYPPPNSMFVLSDSSWRKRITRMTQWMVLWWWQWWQCDMNCLNLIFCCIEGGCSLVRRHPKYFTLQWERYFDCMYNEYFDGLGFQLLCFTPEKSLYCTNMYIYVQLNILWVVLSTQGSKKYTE